MAAPRALHEAFDAQASATPSDVCAVSRVGLAGVGDPGYRRIAVSYAEVQRRSTQLASGLLVRLASAPLPRGPLAPARIVAVRLSRAHPDFLPLLLALSRAGAPFVLLSTDLPDRALEASREALVAEALRPGLLVVDDGAQGSAAALGDVVAVGALAADSSRAHAGGAGATPEAVLCVLFTGGSQRTKVVVVTHAMVLHERLAYKELWRPPSSRPSVVLAHTSVYWGASALGQLSIAIAYGGAVVWCEATEVSELHRCITEEGVTVLGVVPDHLDLLAPSCPARELPDVECVFTWGERLPRRVTERWRGHPRAVLRELLIATEYWLALYSDPLLGDGALRTVSAAEVLLLGEDGRPADGAGELLLSGPMVTLGYLQEEGGDTFLELCGKRYFRTRDLVRRLPCGGLVFKGRADMMAKAKGKWVDMLAVEDDIQRLEDVRAAKVLPDPRQEHFHAFVCLAGEGQRELGETLLAIRELLPTHARVWLLPELPRHPVTRKVDAQRLLRALPRAEPSWPFEGVGPSASSTPARGAPEGSLVASTPQLLQERLAAKAFTQYSWQLIVLGGIVAVSEPGDLPPQLALAAAWGAALAAANGKRNNAREASERIAFAKARAARAFMMTAAWLVVATSVRPSLAKLCKILGSGTMLSFMYLALTCVDDVRHRKVISGWRLRACEAVMYLVDQVPLLKFGFFMLLRAMQHRLVPRPVASTCHGLALLLTCGGMVIAARRGRLLAWPVMLWSVGIGTQIEVECAAWTNTAQWHWELVRLASLPVTLARGLAEGWRLVTGGPPPPPPPAEPAQGDALTAFQCAECLQTVLGPRWRAQHPVMRGSPMCRDCAATWASQKEEAAAEWLRERFRPEIADRRASPAQAPAKRRRVDSEASDDGAVANACPPRDILVHDRGSPGFEPVHSFYESRPDWESWGRGFRNYERWWWFNLTEEYYDANARSVRLFEEALRRRGGARHVAPQQPVVQDEDPREAAQDARVLCALVGEQAPQLAPASLRTPLAGMDSLKLARLAYAIRARLRRSLTSAQLRAAGTVGGLLDALREAEPAAPPAADSAPEQREEFKVWFSPGQHSPMGSWVLRTDDAAFDHGAMRRAVARLIDRHAALRAEVPDPMHYMSVVYDSAALWSLYFPIIERAAASHRLLRLAVDVLRRAVGRSLQLCWPSVRCRSRREIYASRFPEEPCVPLVVVREDSEGRALLGQRRFENELKRRSRSIDPPAQVTLCEVTCYLVDLWAFRDGSGHFAIVRTGLSTSTVGLAYVDAASGEWGPLVGPSSEEWRTPPYRFPALFFVPLSSGKIAWLRLDGDDEVHVLYKESEHRTAKEQHGVAFRAAPERPREAGGEPTVVRYLAITLYHCFGDGNSYMPVAEDLFTLYEAERFGQEAELPPAPGTAAFELLERRLADTLFSRPSTTRASLRGGLWRYEGPGYGYTFGFQPGAVALIERAAASLGLPLDVTLLGLTVCAQAHADERELVEFTMYAPMRDGVAESTMTGLFSDWRDIYIGVDLELATVAGTLLQVYHTIQHRHWTPFNALRKPERTVFNMQPLDMQRRSHFQHLGENMWHGGDSWRDGPPKRAERMEWGRQPLTFNLEQQDESTWWLLVDVGNNERPPSWMRRFSLAMHQALDALFVDPLARVHRPLLPEGAMC